MHTVVFFVCLISTTFALHLPSYIEPCKREDPNLNECVVNQARKAYPTITKGDRKYKSSPLNPLHLPLIEVNAGANLKLTLKNLSVKGLENLKIKKANFDLKNNKIGFVFGSTLIFDGEYDMSGQILVLPIKGNGHSNITFAEGEFFYNIEYTLLEKNKQQYAKINKSDMEMKIQRAYFDFENLFNGDKLLGDNMNQILNENWQDVMKEVGPGISHTIKSVINQIFGVYLENIPFEEIFV